MPFYRRGGYFQPTERVIILRLRSSNLSVIIEFESWSWPLYERFHIARSRGNLPKRYRSSPRGYQGHSSCLVSAAVISAVSVNFRIKRTSPALAWRQSQVRLPPSLPRFRLHGSLLPIARRLLQWDEPATMCANSCV